MSAVCEVESQRDWDFPGGPVVKTLHFLIQGPRVPSLVGELRSHMPRGKKKERKKE